MFEIIIQFLFTTVLSSVATFATVITGIFAWILKSAWIAPAANWAVRRMMAGPMKPVLLTIKHDFLYVRHAFKHPHFPMSKEIHAMLICLFAVLLWSAYKPLDHQIWLLDFLPAFIEFGILVFIFFKYPFTPVFYRLLFLQLLIMLVGAHDSYAHAPMGRWISDLLRIERNSYDRFANFIQGFALALFCREILLRTTSIKKNMRLFVFCIGVPVCISAMFETVQWLLSFVFDKNAFPISQIQYRNPWDPYFDVMMVLIGACFSLSILSKLHDRQLARLKTKLKPK